MLRNCWNRLPIPAGCVALGLIGLGTLLGAYSRLFLFLLGLLSLAIQICVLIKLLRSGSLKRLYADRASLSTLAGTSMAMMLTAAPMRTVLHLRIAVLYWGAGLLLHLALMISFFSWSHGTVRPPAQSYIHSGWLQPVSVIRPVC